MIDPWPLYKALIPGLIITVISVVVITCLRILTDRLKAPRARRSPRSLPRPSRTPVVPSFPDVMPRSPAISAQESSVPARQALYAHVPAVQGQSLPFKPKFQFFVRSEQEFYGALLTALRTSSLVVFPKVRLIDVVYLSRHTPDYMTHFNRANQKHVDFVLCDRQELRPLLAIELDGESHDLPGCRVADAQKNEILAAAGLPLLRVCCAEHYDPRELVNQINMHIRSASK